MISKLKKSVLKNRSRIRKNENSRPIVLVSRSNKNLIAQIIDFETNNTLFTFNTNKLSSISKSQKSQEVASSVANYLLTKKIDSVIFNRNGYRYHGRIKAFAETLREKGINI